MIDETQTLENEIDRKGWEPRKYDAQYVKQNKNKQKREIR